MGPQEHNQRSRSSAFIAVLHLIPVVANPIFIHSTVVLMRIHWFKKKFGHVVVMSKQPSRARTMSTHNPQNNGPRDGNEGGIRGREIKVLHEPASNEKLEGMEGRAGSSMHRSSFSPGTTDSSPGASRPVSIRMAETGSGSHPTLNGNMSTTSIATSPGTNTIMFDDEAIRHLPRGMMISLRI